MCLSGVCFGLVGTVLSGCVWDGCDNVELCDGAGCEGVEL